MIKFMIRLLLILACTWPTICLELEAASSDSSDVKTAIAETLHDDHPKKKENRPFPHLVRWTFMLGYCVIIIGILLCLYRLLAGPHLADRVLAGDAIAMHIAALTVLIITATGLTDYFDAVYIVAMVGFASTVAFAQFIARRELDHAEARFKESLTVEKSSSESKPEGTDTQDNQESSAVSTA